MANTNINPFGQGGTLPSGYPIADDLETASAQKALSAKQGVILKGLIDNNAGVRHLNILVLGNSFSADSFGYLPAILKGYGITCTVGFHYITGGTVNDQVSYYDTIYGNSDGYYNYFEIDTRTATSWTSYGRETTLHAAVLRNHWDIVVLQQSSAKSVDSSSFGQVQTLIDLVLADVDYPLMFAWNINHSSSANDQPSAILTNAQSVYEAHPFDFVFPYGTAIFDARQNQTLDGLGATGHLRADDAHLQEGTPCYIAALTNVQTLFKHFYPHLSVVGDDYTPATTDTILTNGTLIALTTETRLLAQQCAVMANKFPFEIKGV